MEIILNAQRFIRQMKWLYRHTCHERLLLTTLMLITTTAMLFTQFPENRELLIVNVAGYAVIHLCRWRCMRCNTKSLILTGLWFLLATALPCMLMP